MKRKLGLLVALSVLLFTGIASAVTYNFWDSAPAQVYRGSYIRNVPGESISVTSESTAGDSNVFVTNWPSFYPVTGTFYQATQPVSISSMPSTPVTGTFWPDTQPVSGNVGITGSVGVTGTFYPETQPVSGSVSVSNFPSSYAVTGSFYQATQPVSIASMPSTPVTGTFYPDTQPISGSVSISGSVGVTGTFYQTTQPVSISSMPSTPVTGTFWPETQPVSGSVSVGNFPATQPISGSVTVSGTVDTSGSDSEVYVTNMPSTLAVTGSFYQATQPVSIASMPSTPVTGTFYQATQPVSIASMPSTPVTGTFWQETQPVSGNVTATLSGTIEDTNSDTIAGLLADLKTLLASQTFTNSMVDLTCADTGTVYSYTLPSNCVWYEMTGRQNYDFHYALASGDINTAYRTIRAGEPVRVPSERNAFYTGTLYFQCEDLSNFVVEIRVCTKQ